MTWVGKACLLLTLMSVTVLAGCGGATTRLFTKPIAESTYVTYQEWGPNRTVAVLPFINVSKDRDAALKSRELFMSELYISGAFKDVVDEGEMFEVMKKLKLRETDPLGKDAVKTLGDNLGVQAIIFSTVEEYNERSSKPAQFAISMRMVDVDTGQILWLGNASKEGGGSVSEALGLSDGPMVLDVARGVIDDLISDLAGEVRHRKVKSKKVEEAAVKKDLEQKTAVSDNKVEPAPEAQIQAGATPSPAVKSTSAGITYTPVLGGN